MAGIKSKNTKPELALRVALHKRGFRYRLHSTRLDGRPDLILPKYGAVVFVHGCFWHRHEGCKLASTPSTRKEFWQQKFAANMQRDEIVGSHLSRTGWRVAVVWECALKKPNLVDLAANRLSSWLKSDDFSLQLGSNDISGHQ